MPGALLLTEPTARDHTHPFLLQELKTVVLVWRQALFLGVVRIYRGKSGKERGEMVNDFTKALWKQHHMHEIIVHSIPAIGILYR